ncbi:hypothetical protein ACTFIT_008790 [Dictyostelium discoideum]
MNSVQITKTNCEYSIANVPKVHIMKASIPPRYTIQITPLLFFNTILKIPFSLGSFYCIIAILQDKYQLSNHMIHLILLNSIGSVSRLDKNNDENREENNNKSLPGGELSLQYSKGEPWDYSIFTTIPRG